MLTYLLTIFSFSKLEKRTGLVFCLCPLFVQDDVGTAGRHQLTINPSILDFNKAMDDRVAVAPASYANHPSTHRMFQTDKLPHQHLISYHSIFTDHMPFLTQVQPTVSKHWRHGPK